MLGTTFCNMPKIVNNNKKKKIDRENSRKQRYEHDSILHNTWY